MANSLRNSALSIGISLVLTACGASSRFHSLGTMGKGEQFGVLADSVRSAGADVLATMVIYSSPEEIAAQQRGAAHLAKTYNVPENSPITVIEFVYRFNCERRTYREIAAYREMLDGAKAEFGLDTSSEQIAGVVIPNSPRDRVLEYACMPSWKRWTISRVD